MKDFRDEVIKTLRDKGLTLTGLSRSQYVSLSANALSKLINGAYSSNTKYMHIQNLVKALVEKNVLKTRSKVESLLTKADCPLFEESDWNNPPLDRLKEVNSERSGTAILVQLPSENLVTRQEGAQTFQDETELAWHQRLTLVGNLRPESLKLGDTTAANFPYVITPIQEIYNTAIQALQDASTERRRDKEGVLILGESNAGKTRLAFEALKRTLSTWRVMRWWPDYNLDNALLFGPFDKMALVLLIDDLQDYVPFISKDVDGRSLIMDHRVITLRRLLETLHQVAQKVVVIATCRTEDSTRVQSSLGWLFTRLKNVVIPTFKEDPKDPNVAQTISEFSARGTIHIEDWDGTLGSLVLGLSTKNNQYLNLTESYDLAATVLKAMKLLTLADTKLHTERRLRTVCAGVFNERQLLESVQAWQETVNQLTRLQFVQEELDVESLEMTLVIRKDTYFEKVITDYPLDYRPHQIEYDLTRLQKVFIELEDVQSLLSLGQVRFSRFKNYEEALKTFDCALALDPKNVDAWVWKGLPYVTMGGPYQPEEGLKAFDLALSLDANNPKAWLFKGFVLGELERYEEALIAFDHAIALNPDDIYAWSFKGRILGDLGRYDEGFAAIDRALVLSSEKSTVWSCRGTILLDLRRFEEALVAFDRALTLDPNDPDALYHKGVVLEKLEYPEEGITLIDHALTLDPNNAHAWYHKGSMLRELKRYEEALAAFDHVLACNPSDVEACFYKGIMLKNVKRYKEAINAFDQALDLDSTQSAIWYPAIWHHKGAMLFTLERYEEALAAFDHALVLDPNDVSNWAYKGITLMALEQFEEALLAFDHALTLDSNDIGSWYHKSITLGASLQLHLLTQQ